MHPKFNLLLAVLLFLTGRLMAQTTSPAVINSSGGSYTYLNITYEWSIGELALVESMFGIDYSLTNGQLQPQKTVPADVINGFNIKPNNILSGNGDGDNDTWVIEYLEQYPENEVFVYDRVGRMVFYAKNYQNNWNGQLSDQPLSEDTYYYVIKLKKGDITGIKKGYLTIVR